MRATDQTKGAFRSVETSLNRLSRIGGGTAVGGVAGGAGAFALGSLAIELENLGIRTEVATDGLESFDRTLESVRQRSQLLGQNTLENVAAFSKFAVAARLANLPLKEARALYESIQTYGAVVGLDPTQVAGTFYALEQVLTKGYLRAEELNKQLANRLIGIVPLTAEALGITGDELQARLRAGDITALEFAKSIPAVLDRESAKAGDKIYGRMQASFARVADQWKVEGAKMFTPITDAAATAADFIARKMGAALPDISPEDRSFWGALLSGAATFGADAFQTNFAVAIRRQTVLRNLNEQDPNLEDETLTLTARALLGGISEDRLRNMLQDIQVVNARIEEFEKSLAESFDDAVDAPDKALTGAAGRLARRRGRAQAQADAEARTVLGVELSPQDVENIGLFHSDEAVKASEDRKHALDLERDVAEKAAAAYEQLQQKIYGTVKAMEDDARSGENRVRFATGQERSRLYLDIEESLEDDWAKELERQNRVLLEQWVDMYNTYGILAGDLWYAGVKGGLDGLQDYSFDFLWLEPPTRFPTLPPDSSTTSAGPDRAASGAGLGVSFRHFIRAAHDLSVRRQAATGPSELGRRGRSGDMGSRRGRRHSAEPKPWRKEHQHQRQHVHRPATPYTARSTCNAYSMTGKAPCSDAYPRWLNRGGSPADG